MISLNVLGASKRGFSPAQKHVIASPDVIGTWQSTGVSHCFLAARAAAVKFVVCGSLDPPKNVSSRSHRELPVKPHISCPHGRQQAARRAAGPSWKRISLSLKGEGRVRVNKI